MDLEKVFESYIAAALFSSNYTNEYTEKEEPLDARYDIDDLDEDTAKKLKYELEDFMEDAEGVVQNFWDEEQFGHDFWLTRNGHGSGFWDRYRPGSTGHEVGDKLTKLAKEYGSVDLYVGDDGKIYA
jgi:hypothetical protein